jgi:hypothetical protein
MRRSISYFRNEEQNEFRNEEDQQDDFTNG